MIFYIDIKNIIANIVFNNTNKVVFEFNNLKIDQLISAFFDFEIEHGH